MHFLLRTLFYLGSQHFLMILSKIMHCVIFFKAFLYKLASGYVVSDMLYDQFLYVQDIHLNGFGKNRFSRFITNVMFFFLTDFLGNITHKKSRFTTFIPTFFECLFVQFHTTLAFQKLKYEHL